MSEGEILQHEDDAMVQRYAYQRIAPEGSRPHGADAGGEGLAVVANEEQTDEGWTDKGQQRGCCCMDAERVAEDIYCQSQEESPKHYLVAPCAFLQGEDEPDVEHGRGITEKLYLVQDKHLHEDEDDEVEEAAEEAVHGVGRGFVLSVFFLEHTVKHLPLVGTRVADDEDVSEPGKGGAELYVDGV